MNYYEHHIGDYSQASSHLTFVEDAAYRRLLQKYYATEKPLPRDLKVLQRLVMANKKEEKNAVVRILNEFFTLTDVGWKQARCEKEIARYKDRQNKARRSAELRWEASSVLQKQLKTDQNLVCERIAHHTPDTRHQIPNTILHTPDKHQNNGAENLEIISRSLTPPQCNGKKIMPTNALTAPLALARTQNLSVQIAVLINREVRKPILQDDWRIREMLNLGVNEAQVISAIASAKDARKKHALKTPINAGLILAILQAEDLKNQHAHSPEKAWWKTTEGTQAKGQELGIKAVPGEAYEAYKARIFTYLDKVRQSSKAYQGRNMAGVLSAAFRPLSKGLSHAN